MMRIMQYAIILFVSVQSIQTFAQDGQDRGGGDIRGVGGASKVDRNFGAQEVARAAKYLAEANESLVENLTRLSKLTFIEVTEREHQVLLDLIGSGIIADIKANTFLYNNICKNERDIETTLTTLKGQQRGPICVNVPRLLYQMEKEGRLASNQSKLQSLLLHENARHFQIEDTAVGLEHPLAFYYSQMKEGIKLIYRRCYADLPLAKKSALSRCWPANQTDLWVRIVETPQGSHTQLPGKKRPVLRDDFRKSLQKTPSFLISLQFEYLRKPDGSWYSLNSPVKLGESVRVRLPDRSAGGTWTSEYFRSVQSGVEAPVFRLYWFAPANVLMNDLTGWNLQSTDSASSPNAVFDIEVSVDGEVWVNLSETINIAPAPMSRQSYKFFLDFGRLNN